MMQIPSLLNQQRIHIPQYKHKYAKKKQPQFHCTKI